MIPDTDLACHDDAVPCGRATSDAHLGANQIVSTNLAVVRNLNEVVDFRSLANDGCPIGTPIDGDVRADFHIILNDDVSQLRCRNVPSIFETVTKSVSADDRAGVNRDTLANHDIFVQYDSRVERDVLSNVRAAADMNACMKHRPRPDDGVIANGATGTDRSGFVDLRRRRHKRGWMNASLGRRSVGAEAGDNLAKRPVGVVNADSGK